MPTEIYYLPLCSTFGNISEARVHNYTYTYNVYQRISTHKNMHGYVHLIKNLMFSHVIFFVIPKNIKEVISIWLIELRMGEAVLYNIFFTE